METTKEIEVRGSSVRLWIGVLAGPIAWAATLQAKYALVEWTCQNRAAWLMWLLTAAGVAVCAIGAFFAWSGWGGVERQRDTERVWFMGIAGLIVSAMFAMAIIAMVIPDIYLRPCD